MNPSEENVDYFDVVFSLEDFIIEMLDSAADPPATTPTPSPPSSEQPTNIELSSLLTPAQLQAAEGQQYDSLEAGFDLFDLQTPLASPRSLLQALCEEDSDEPDHMFDQNDDHNKEQDLIDDLPKYNAPTTSSAAVSQPSFAAVTPSLPFNVEPLVLLRDFKLNLQPVVVLKRFHEGTLNGRPYIKKPPNAFMVYMKEQRPHVKAQLIKKGNAAVNAFLGQKWKSLTQEQKAQYYDLAEEERRRHRKLYPNWSSTENYRKKRKRKRVKRTPATCHEAIKKTAIESIVMKTGLMEPKHLQPVLQTAKTSQTSSSAHVIDTSKTPVDDTKDPSASEPSYTVINSVPYVWVMPPTTYTSGLAELKHLRHVLVQLPNMQNPCTVPVCDYCHLPQVYEGIP